MGTNDFDFGILKFLEKKMAQIIWVSIHKPINSTKIVPACTKWLALHFQRKLLSSELSIALTGKSPSIFPSACMIMDYKDCVFFINPLSCRES